MAAVVNMIVKTTTQQYGMVVELCVPVVVIL